MVRLTWKTLGSMLLFLLFILIVIGTQGQVIVLDIVFWFVVAGLMLARYADIKVFHGLTADNEQATMKDWFGYSVRLTVASGLLWILSHIVRNWLY